jgi:PAS domain S-box-containing protein
MFFVEKYYKTVAAGIFVILTILVMFNIVLRHKVTRKTAKLNDALSRLQMSEGRLNAVLSAIPSIIFIIDKNFTFVDILTSKKELLYVPKEVAIGKTFKDIFAQDKVEFFMNYTNIVIRIQMEVEFFYDLKIGDETRYFISTGVPLKIGDEIFALFQVSDNTELVLTNESLKKTASELSIEKDKLNRILNSVKEMVLVTDKNGKITYINRAVRHFCPEVSEGENIDRLVLLRQENDDRYNLPISDIVNQIFAEHTFKDIYLKKDNGKILLEGSIQPIFDYMSVVTGALIVLRDVTEEKKLEEEMIKADKLDTIGRIAAGIAHDFNNYLGALQNYINVLKLENDDSIIEIASKMEVVINKSKSLTKQLLTFSKGGNFVLKRTDIATLLKTVSEFSLKGSGITLIENIPDESVCCEIDEGLFSQVISNLVINAKEAMNNKGRIEVSLSKMHLCKANNYLLDEGDYAKISIRDNGPGIPEELRGKVFEPFFTTKSYGTGLGLTTSYSIVKQHNGYMDFINHPDGCEFVIFLKLTSCEGVSNGAEEANIEKPEKEEEINILYIDDEDFLRDSFELLMTTLNCRVKTVSRGEEALEAVEKEKYDMIVLDLTIREGMDGIKTIKALHEKGVKSYFVVSSGYSEDPVLQHLTDYGFNDYLLKPYSLKETKDMLEKFRKYRSGRPQS